MLIDHITGISKMSGHAHHHPRASLIAPLSHISRLLRSDIVTSFRSLR